MLSYLNTIEEVGQSGIDTAIIPVGSVEQHGSHLPIGSDYLLAKAVAEEIARRMNALLYPTIPFSTCYEHKGKRGSLCMRPTTFHQLLQDLVLNLRDQGFRRVIILLFHGGAFAAGPAVRELNALYDDIQVVLVQEYSSEKILSVLENKSEIHAGEFETSLLLYLHKELVDTEKMMQNDCIPPYPQSFLNHAPLLKLSETGVWGKPSLASAEKGEKLFEYVVEASIDYINKAFEVSPENKW